MKVWPVGLVVEQRLCLVVGRGHAAKARAATLLERGARVRAVTGAPDPELNALLCHDDLELVTRNFEQHDLDDCWLCVVANPGHPFAEEISRLCAERRIWFCAVDQPTLSSFSHMALARAGPLSIAIGTDGRVPALSRRLRSELQRLLDEADFERVVRELSELRASLSGEERLVALKSRTESIRIVGHLETKKAP